MCGDTEVRNRARREQWLYFQGPHGHAWSALDDARLAALAVIGAPIGVAMAILSRGKHSIIYRRAQLGLPRLRGDFQPRACQRWDEARVKALEHALRIEGLSYSQAAERFGTTRSAISGAVTVHLSHLRRPRVRG